ncbi:MAG: hypothetical protein IPP78_16160 [Holophagaceae bacterium]|nr:hypothetical protein [Holophagaceae bacterium]
MTIHPEKGYKPTYVPKAERAPRDNGLYAMTKIEAFIRYCRAAEKVFKGQKARGKIRKIVHFEPFCGPGWNRTKDGKHVFEGTPLRAVKELKHYDVFIFNDYDKGIMDCLYSEFKDLRLDEKLDVEIYLTVQDANQSVRDLDSMLPKKIGMAFPFLGSVIVDPEDLWFSWSSTAMLARKRLDLLEMVPTHIDLARNIKNPSAHNYVGNWLGEAPVSDDLNEVLSQYEGKLKNCYKWVLGVSTNPLPEKEYIWVKGKYHLISASNCPNDVASKIWTGEVRRTVKETKGTPLFEGLDL